MLTFQFLGDLTFLPRLVFRPDSAGASGLTVMKELTALGHKVMCFEESIRIGGVYTKSYDRTMLTTSSVLTAFSDYSQVRQAAFRLAANHDARGWTNATAAAAH